MSFIPDGHWTFSEASDCFGRWLSKAIKLSFDDDKHHNAEAKNQLRQALITGDAVGIVFDSRAGRRKVSKDYWIENENFERALREGEVKYPVPLSKGGIDYRPVFLSVEEIRNHLFGRKRSHRYGASFGKRKSYRLLDWPPHDEPIGQYETTPRAGRPRERDGAARLYWKHFRSGHYGHTWKEAVHQINQKEGTSYTVDTVKRGVGAKK